MRGVFFTTEGLVFKLDTFIDTPMEHQTDVTTLPYRQTSGNGTEGVEESDLYAEAFAE